MIIEIRKAGFVNKGAELMLYAILDKMKKAFPDARFCMLPKGNALYYQRAELGLYQKIYISKRGINLSMLGNLLPKKLREMYGLVLEKEIDVVLDAAGFSYSDQWGVNSCYELSQSCIKWKKENKTIILLPQALGPFNSPNNKRYFREALKNIDLVFVREKISYEFVMDLADKKDNIQISPDFTNLIDGILPITFDIKNNRICIVPNFRMIDKTLTEDSEAYLPLLIKCTKYLLDRGKKPFILVHEGYDDMQLAIKINDAVGGNISIVKESHPLKIKGIIGTCDAMIGSRFHGIISALSQGVPALATGWSHKYKMLFEDYGFNEGLLKVTISDEELYKKLDLIVDDSSNEYIKKLLNEKAIILKQKSQLMWDDVITTIKLKYEVNEKL